MKHHPPVFCELKLKQSVVLVRSFSVLWHMTTGGESLPWVKAPRNQTPKGSPTKVGWRYFSSTASCIPGRRRTLRRQSVPWMFVGSANQQVKRPARELWFSFRPWWRFDKDVSLPARDDVTTLCFGGPRFLGNGTVWLSLLMQFNYFDSLLDEMMVVDC
ncbi:hypothetical protein EX30DRAFT_257282 [Ascodesmis nigricans]|uniref:Uncharacterized protein n=1 Tax=Ascodesmis nigricans TaxID=341454 RepID=A0A4S2MPP9_9PEZI|nr:hypothetical protein EX30DRAFT_257282 [Ascodesmis nigricans]